MARHRVLTGTITDSNERRIRWRGRRFRGKPATELLMTRARLSLFYLVAAVLGAISSGTSLVVVNLNHVVAPAWIGYVFDLLIAITLFIAGRQAKVVSGHPARVGTLTGGIYGLFTGLWILFAKINRTQLIQELRARHSPLTNLNAKLHAANSPAIHLIGLAGTVILGLVVGLILGFAGGFTARRRDEQPGV